MLLALKGRKAHNAELDNNPVMFAAQYFGCGTSKNAEPTYFFCECYLNIQYLEFAAHLMCLFGTFGTVHSTKTREHLCKLQKVKRSQQLCGDG